jgi:hypothetical protein
MNKHMKFFKLSLITLTAATILTGCNLGQTEQTSSVNPYPSDITERQIELDKKAYWAKENLDLQAVGAMLERADDAEEFERLLNSGDGVNNLDLNGDGDVDYISVREFEDESDDQRGFSLFSMFGPNEIQEIATLIFNRQGLNSNGARVLLSGNEQIYGDNNFYETNWVDRAVPIVSWLFNKDRNTNYQSPYYYENYPDYYESYQVVETPVYRSRIEQYYTAPVFIQTNAPTITQIKIKSPYSGKSMDKIYSKLAKPTKEQMEFSKNNPNPPAFEKVKKEKTKDFSDKQDKQWKENQKQFEKVEKIEKVKNDKSVREMKPNKIEKENFKQNNPFKMEKQNNKPQKQDNPAKQNGGGNPNKGDKGNGKGNGGGGKGGGKKN